MLGTRGIWHDGWFANTVHAAPARRAGRTSTTTAGSCSTSTPTAASATTWPPSIPDKLDELKALWFAEAGEVQRPSARRPQHAGDASRGSGRTLAGGRTSFTYYPGTAAGRHGRGGRAAGPVLLGAGRGQRGHRRCRGRALQAGRRPWRARAVRRRTAGCTTSTTSWARTSRRVSSPDPIPLGRHVLGVRYERTGTVEGSHTPLGTVTLYVDERRGRDPGGRAGAPGHVRPGRRRRQVGRNSGQAVSTRLSPRRSRSPAAPSPRWSSTSPARRTSTGSGNWRWRSPGTDSVAGADRTDRRVLTELVELPGGSFRMGSTSFYPEEAPDPHRHRGGLRHRAPPGDQRAVRRVRRRHRLRHRRRAPAGPRAVSRCGARGSAARGADLPRHARAR